MDGLRKPASWDALRPDRTQSYVDEEIYAIRYGDGEIDDMDSLIEAKAKINVIRENIAQGYYEKEDYEPMAIVQRTVVHVPDLVSEWEEIE